MRAVLIKVCGLRRLADARLASDLGAHFLGCVVAEDSPRAATLAEIQAVAERDSLRQKLVLVFRGVEPPSISRLAKELRVARVQVHGAKEDACCWLDDQGLIVHRVHRVAEDAQELPQLAPLPTAHCPAVLDVGPGGGGRAFDWSILAKGSPQFTFIAGGVSPENVSELLAYRPYGVDLSSGLESSAGIKDHAALRRLFAVVETNA